MGMGHAYVSLSGDASAPFWNSAAIAGIDRPEFMAFRTTLFLETNYDCLGFSYPMENIGVFSLSLGRIGADNIPRRDQFNRLIDTFSSSETQLGLSYARDIIYGLNGGITIKAVSKDIGGAAGAGTGADLGFQFSPPFAEYITLGMGFNDLIRPGIKLLSAQDKYATVSRFGIASSNKVGDKFQFTESLELNSSAGRKTRFMIGAEMAYTGQYFLRAGYNYERITFGAGIIYRFIKLDYAFENYEFLGASHKISFGVSFGKSVGLSREARLAGMVEKERKKWEANLAGRQSLAADSIVIVADSLLVNGQYQEALFNYEKSLALDSGSEKARVMVDSVMNLIIFNSIRNVSDKKREELIAGRVQSALNDQKAGLFNDAILKYNLLIEIDPGNKALTDLLKAARNARTAEITRRREQARTRQEQGDLTGALAEWNQVLSLDRNDAMARSQSEIVLKQMRANDLVAAAVASVNEGNFERAADYLSRAQELKPDDRSIRNLLIDTRSKSVPPTSLEDIKANSEHWSIYISALESYQASDYNKAIETWERLRDFYPNNPDLEKNISQARQRLSAQGGNSRD